MASIVGGRRFGDARRLDDAVGPKDVFPRPFLAHYAALLDPDDWNLHKQRILAGAMLDVFPYEPQRCFVNQRAGLRSG